jgi:hypothetical protein
MAIPGPLTKPGNPRVRHLLIEASGRFAADLGGNGASVLVRPRKTDSG